MTGLRERLGIGPEAPIVVAILRGGESPDALATATSAVRRIPDTRLVVIAPERIGALTSTLRRVVKNQDAGVHAIGMPSVPDLVALCAEADSGILAEGVAADSAFAHAVFTQAGLPILAPTDAPQADAVRDDKVGAAYPTGRIRDLARSMLATTRRKEEFAARIDDEMRRATSWCLEVDLPPHEGRDPLLAVARVGVGPANYASQANAWAMALRDHLLVDAESFSVPGNARRRPDRMIATHGRSDFHAVFEEMETVLSRYSHLLVDAFKDVLAGVVSEGIGPELDILRRNGTQVALVAHGSEVRHPLHHMARIPFSYFADAPEEWVEALVRVCERNRAVAESFDGPVFVSTPDLLHDLPFAMWLPVVIPEPHVWESGPILQHGGVPRVLHRPSRTDPPVKGSEHIMPILEQLAAEGLLDLVHSPERVPPEQMPELIRSADILIDQIQTGSYGVISVEAMWAGRVVVGWIAPDVRALAGIDIPVVDAAPDDFERVMRDLVSRPGDLLALAERGRAYAHEVHDGRRSAEVLRGFVETPVRI